MEHVLVLVQVLDKLRDPALVTERLLARGLLLLQLDFEPLVQEGQLAQTRGQDVVVKFDDGENLAVREEGDLCAGALRFADRLQLRHGPSALVALVIHVSIAPHFDFQPLAQRVDARDADAVQPARNLVAVVVELAAGVEHRENDFHGRFLLRGVHVHRDAAPVVVHRNRTVRVHLDLDRLAVPGQRLVHAVVHDLVHAVVKAANARVADVHRGALPHRVHTAEDRDRLGIVLVAGLIRCRLGQILGL